MMLSHSHTDTGTQYRRTLRNAGGRNYHCQWHQGDYSTNFKNDSKCKAPSRSSFTHWHSILLSESYRLHCDILFHSLRMLLAVAARGGVPVAGGMPCSTQSHHCQWRYQLNWLNILAGNLKPHASDSESAGAAQCSLCHDAPHATRRMHSQPEGHQQAA